MTLHTDAHYQKHSFLKKFKNINFVKVDRVCSVEEALELESMGVNAICVSLVENVRFSDRRVIDMDTAVEIRQSLKNADYIAEVDIDWEIPKLIEIATRGGFSILQANNARCPSLSHRMALKAEGLSLSYSYNEVTHDDGDVDVSMAFFQSEKSAGHDLNAAFYQLDLLSEYDNAWNFLKFEADEYPDDTVQIENINTFSKEWPTLACLDYSPSNVKDIVESLPNLQGIAMVLVDNSLREDFHFFDLDSVKEVLNALQSV